MYVYSYIWNSGFSMLHSTDNVYMFFFPFIWLYPTTINNSLKASKLLINQPMPKIEEFKQRFLFFGWVGLIMFIFSFNMNSHFADLPN